MTEFNTGKLIAEIIAANAETLFDASKKFFDDKGNQIKVRLSSTFSDYVESIERKYSSTKTIIYRDTPQIIKNFYEPIDLSNDKISLKNPNINDLLKLGRPTIITGTGGSGKSTFLKYLLLNSLESTKLIPLFVELRIVEQEQKSLMTYICDSLQLNKVNLGEEYLKQAFGRGNFLFLLDGFDELSTNYAQRISTEIESLSQIYSLCTFILTSRPGQDFTSWSNFIELKTKPLTVEKAVSLIQRLNYDQEIKQNFIKQLKGDLYDSHRSFFENPLLLSIMLITFRDSASIPSELHNFYSLAFEALYYRHDASKAFKRPTVTNLPVNRGKEIMASFSLITYLNNQTLFNGYELKDLLGKAMKLADCECEVDDLVYDLQRAYCMLIQDGTKYQYTHRSFQEYFAACYLIGANEASQSRLIRQFCSRAESDITLDLAYGMNPKMIEEKLIIPFLKEFRETIGYTSEVTGDIFMLFSKHYFNNITILDKNLLTLSLENFGESQEYARKALDLQVVRFILRIYEINREYDYKVQGFDFAGILLDKSQTRNILEIGKAFEIPGLLEWFVRNSLEARVIKNLMELEKRLCEKNKRNTELFESLLEDKTTSQKRVNEKKSGQ